MKRFAVLFAAGVFLIPAAGCEDTGGGGGDHAVPRGNDDDTHTRPDPEGAVQGLGAAGEGGRRDGQSQRPEERSLRPSLSLHRQRLRRGQEALELASGPLCGTNGSCRFGSRPLSSNPFLEPDNTGI